MKTYLTIATAAALAFASHRATAINGDLDPGFGSSGLGLTEITDAAGNGANGPVIQPDGKILICDTRTQNGASGRDMFVARFNPDGTLDTSFSFDGKVTIDFDAGAGEDGCNGLALQADGRIVVVGLTSIAGNTDFAIARLTSDGTLDTTFGAGTGKTTVAFDLVAQGNDTATSVAIQADGKIVVAGTVATASNGKDFGIVRLLSDGTRDPAFNLTGKVSYGFDIAGSSTKNDLAQAVAIDGAGRIVVGGMADASTSSSVSNDFVVLRLLPTGQLDPNFDADGRAVVAFDLGASHDDEAFGLLLQQDDRIVLVGAVDTSPTAGTPNYDMAAARLLPDGSADNSFGIGGKTLIPFDLTANGTDAAFGVVEQGNGKLVLVGYAMSLSGSPGGLLAAAARLNRDGGPDANFGTLGKMTYDFGMSAPSAQLLHGIAQHRSELYAAGGLRLENVNFTVDDFVVHILDELIFADGFD